MFKASKNAVSILVYILFYDETEHLDAKARAPSS